MPILDFKFPEPYLYRGHFQPQEKGGLLFPITGKTCLGEHGHYVFASHQRLQAAAYVFKEHAVQIGCIHVDPRRRYWYALIKMPLGKTADDILNETGYFQKLSSSGFKGVFLIDRDASGREVYKGPTEAVSREPVYILDLKKIPCRRAIEWGVQVFSTEKEDAHYLSCGMQYVDAIREMVEQKVIRWENLRPEFDVCPAARPKAFLKALGFG